MRGEKEQQCLDRIKDATFTKDGALIKHPFTGKTYTEIRDDEFAKEQIWYINSNCHNNYFGLLEADRNEFERILRKAEPNQKMSIFPDFVFANGFIEHFQVTSSSVTRKGSNHAKKASSSIGLNLKQNKLKMNGIKCRVLMRFVLRHGCLRVRLIRMSS